MKIKNIKNSFPLVCLTILLTMSIKVNAGIIQIGHLSGSDDGRSLTIQDSLNNYEWLRLDVLAGLNYEQTLAATQAEFSGWKIAGVKQATQFYSALAGETGCAQVSAQSGCNRVAGDFVGLFGDNGIIGRDVFAFYHGSERDAGLFGWSPTSNNLLRFDSWGSFARTDLYSRTGAIASQAISWLLYKDLNPIERRITNAISEPGLSVFLLSLLLLMLGRRTTKVLPL